MTSHAALYLTFDDGPDPEWTPRILDLLAQADMQATFFAIGEQAQRSPRCSRRIVDGRPCDRQSHVQPSPSLVDDARARARAKCATARRR